MTSQVQKGPQRQSVFNTLSDKVAVTGARFQGGELQAIHIAIIKATNHDEVVPKEKHVRTLKQAVSSGSSRAHVVQVIQGLNERLKSGEWLIVLKTLMVYHRLFREADVTFQEEFCTLEKGRGLLAQENFTDVRGGKEVFDYSAFVRSFSLYLNQRKDLYDKIRYDSEHDNSDNSVILGFSPSKILEAIPLLHKLLQRIVNSIPEGKAARNAVVQSAVVPLIRECLRLYRTAQEGLVKLIDVFFEMDQNDALRCVQIYREALELHERLLDYFQKIQNIPDLGSQVHMPTLQPLPSDFLSQMEDYAANAGGQNSQQPPYSSYKAPIRSKTMQSVAPVSAATSVLSGRTDLARNTAMSNVKQSSIDLMKLTLSTQIEVPEADDEFDAFGPEAPSPEQDPFSDSNWGQQADPFGDNVLGQAINPSVDPFGSNGYDPFASLVVAKETVAYHDPFLPASDVFQQEDPFISVPQEDPFQSKQLGDPFESNGISPPISGATTLSDPFLASNMLVLNADPTSQTNPFTQTKPTSGPTRSNTLRRQKDPLELLNEELGIIKKEEPKSTVAMNQMRMQK